MLLDRAKTIIGPLSHLYKQKIYRYLNEPSFEGWDEIHCIVLSWGHGGPRTVWQALVGLDPSYRDIAVASGRDESLSPQKRWKKIPDSLTLARAIKKMLDGA